MGRGDARDEPEGGNENGNGAEGHVLRSFPFERAFAVAGRSLHLVGAGAVTGAIVVGASPFDHAALLWLAVLTGAFLQANDLYRYGRAYFSTAMFWILAAKLVLVGLALHAGRAAAATCIVLSVVASGVVSHMPGSWRHHRLWPPLGRSPGGDAAAPLGPRRDLS